MSEESKSMEEKEKGAWEALSSMSKIHAKLDPPKQSCHNPLDENHCETVIDLSQTPHPPIDDFRRRIADSCFPLDKVLNKNEAHGRTMRFKRAILEDDGVLDFLERNGWNINQGIEVTVFDRQGTEYGEMTLRNRGTENRPYYVLQGENWNAFCNANDFKNEVGNIIGLWFFREKMKEGLGLAIMIASRKNKHGTAITNRSYFDDHPLNKRRREDDDDDDDDGDDQGSSKKQSRYPTRSSRTQRSVAIH